MEKFTQCRTSWFAFLSEYLLGDQITKNNNTEGACGTWGRQERCIKNFGWEPWEKYTTWKTWV